VVALGTTHCGRKRKLRVGLSDRYGELVLAVDRAHDDQFVQDQDMSG
jgi:hypothetical protein